MLRAAGAPERFLARGLSRHLPAPRGGRASSRSASSRSVPNLGVRLPLELARFVTLVRAPFGEYVPLRAVSTFPALLASAKTNADTRAHLTSLLAGALPFGTTPTGEIWLYMLDGGASPARRIVATLDPRAEAPLLVCRGVSALAVLCALHDHLEDVEAREAASRISKPGVAEQEAFRSAFERAQVITTLLLGSDVAVRRAARSLARKPLEDVPPPDTRRQPRDRDAPLALGALLEVFFREDDAVAASAALDHEASEDIVVVKAATLLGQALSGDGRSALAKDLARRRELALRAVRDAAPSERRLESASLPMTRAIVAHIDATPSPTDPLSSHEGRTEALLALAELGDRAVLPSLIARAVTGDIGAVEMLGMMGDPQAIPHLLPMLAREPERQRHLEAAVVRALGRLRATDAAPALRQMLADNPLTNWREGIERAVLVREIVSTLGALRDEAAGPALVGVLEARSQEYRTIRPITAWALGRLAHAPALRALEHLLCSPKETVTCEGLWAVGEIGRAHAAKKRAGALLDAVSGLEPGAEMTRLTALAKVRGASPNAPRAQDLRRALERALWEPGFRQEETARRRVWALRALRDLRGTATVLPREDVFFLGHDAVRFLVTREDARVRRAAEKAFAAWAVPVPKARRYYSVVVEQLEREGDLEALHDALRDPLGVHRHNVATRLAARGDDRSVGPLAEATARLFAEPATSQYEYDDAPRNLVAFVRALAKLNRRAGNDVLIEGLRHGNHQVRAVVAENAPDDPRFVPELQAMLGDPRSFLRSRAERSLTSLGVLAPVHEMGSNAPPRLVEG